MQKFYKKAHLLLAQMTVEEKVAQLVSAWLEISNDGTFSVREYGGGSKKAGDRRQEVLGAGIGQLTRPYGTMANEAKVQAKAINAIQRYLVTETRLKIPAMIHEECLTGAMVCGATIFPSALNYGSSWDPALIEKIGAAIGGELRSLGVNQGLAPVLDVARDARWGRLEETFGEDPYLAGEMAIAYVNGIQGEGKQPLATLKHFVGHSASEGGRNHAPVHLGKRELLNIFALPFEMTVQHTDIGSVMPAYHDIDGIPTTCDRELLTDLLRTEWGFEGSTVSDYEAPIQLLNEHRVANDLAEAAALAFNAGLEIELPGYTVYKQGLAEAIERKLVAIETIDAAVLKVLAEKYRQGLFENPYIDEGAIDLGNAANHQLAVEAAEASIVLLKNDGILPLAAGQKVAVIGPLADHPFAMLGGYSPAIHLQGSMDALECVPPEAQTIRSALETLIGSENVHYEPGCMLYENAVERAVFFPGDVTESTEDAQALSTDTSRLTEAARVVQESDVTILVVGDLAGLFGNGTVGEGSDVSSLALPGVQQALFDMVLDTGKPVVVVLVSGRPYDLRRADKEAHAILATWLPGEGGGEAIGRTLVGLNNPSGRSIISFPQVAGSAPYAYNHAQKAGGLPVQAEFPPLYSFGHGLSYTSFTISDLELNSTEMPSDGAVELSVIVTNTGKVAGSEVVQLYSTDQVASIVRPVQELKAFAKVHLAPHESARVTFTLPAHLFSFIGPAYKRIVEPGVLSLQVGQSCQAIACTAEVTITGEVTELDRHWSSRASVAITPR